MRQGQQNRRGRGRNRKGQNPLTRSFDSNGPDQKIRGTPTHIAEKYMSLARDALSAGDPVLAENYLQHAEHYNRIIMSYREQQSQPNIDAANGTGHRNRPQQNGTLESAENVVEGETENTGEEQSLEGSAAKSGTQNGRNNGNERSSRNRGDGGQRERRGRGPNSNRQNGRQSASREAGSGRRANNEREGFGSDEAQPEFLKRPVRRTRREDDSASEEAEATTDPLTVKESQD